MCNRICGHTCEEMVALTAKVKFIWMTLIVVIKATIMKMINDDNEDGNCVVDLTERDRLNRWFGD